MGFKVLHLKRKKLLKIAVVLARLDLKSDTIPYMTL